MKQSKKAIWCFFVLFLFIYLFNRTKEGKWSEHTTKQFEAYFLSHRGTEKGGFFLFLFFLLFLLNCLSVKTQNSKQSNKYKKQGKKGKKTKRNNLQNKTDKQLQNKFIFIYFNFIFFCFCLAGLIIRPFIISDSNTKTKP